MSNYTAKDIQVLKGLHAVRKTPGMYVGDLTTGVIQICREAIDNAIDEYLIGKNNCLYIEVDTKKNSIIVADKGRGIPVEKHPDTGISTLTTVMTYLHSGAKFGKQISIGTHGVGISCSNALSKSFEVWTYRNNYWYYQSFSRGEPTSNVVKKKPPCLKVKWKRGTIIRMVPDEEIFNDYSSIPYRKLLKWIKEDLIYLCPGLKVYFVVDEVLSEFKSDGGIQELVSNMIDSQKIGPMFYYKSKDLDVALQWTAGDENIKTFVNCTRTIDDGSHFSGFKKALGDVLAPRGSYPSMDRDDLRSGLVGAIHVRISNPNYSSQTKEKLSDKRAEKLVYDVMKEQLNNFFTANRQLAERIVNNAIRISKAREKFNQDAKAIKGVQVYDSNKKGILPTKLLESTTNDPKERELFICEGDSALGTLKDARDSRYQEVLPIRGKFPNAYKISPNKVLENEDVKNIIVSVGSNILDKCDPDKSRVGKVIFISDADPDGCHINCLLISLFSAYMRELLAEGKVYVVDAPLFIAEWKGRKYFGNTIKEIKKQLPKHAKPLITRLKGWGTLNSDDMRTIAMDEKTRKLIPLKLKDGDLKAIERIMGKETEARKLLLGL